MVKIACFSLVTFLIAVALPAQANYSCEGKVNYFGVDDGVWVNNGFGVHKLCSNNDQSNIEKCSMWFSMVMAAQAQNREVAIYYRDNTGKTASACTEIGNWVDPNDAIYFVRIL